MNKVWVVCQRVYDDHEIMAVFSTEELAEGWLERNVGMGRSYNFYVEEWAVDES